MNEENVKLFEELLLSTKRDGIDKLLEFIRKSDFYTAPASTRFHLSCDGGLLQHSLNVYTALIGKYKTDSLWKETLKDVPVESVISSAWLHDVCMVYVY